MVPAAYLPMPSGFRLCGPLSEGPDGKLRVAGHDVSELIAVRRADLPIERCGGDERLARECCVTVTFED